MSLGVFSRTIGLRGEDAATEVLAHLLSPETLNVPFQKLFFLKICQIAKSSADLNAEFVMRPVCPGGTPDALILTEDSLILLENKLGSPLSGVDQLVRYVQILRTNDGMAAVFPTFEADRIRRRILVFLAPRGTIGVSLHATARYAFETTKQHFDALCKDGGIVLLPLAWEDLIVDLDDSNALQRELRLYVQDYLEQELTMREKEVLTDTNVPAALDKLFKKLTTMRDSLSAEGFVPGRMGQSYNFFGFNATHERVTLWFGYALPQWATYGTPIFLQLRKKWIKTDEEQVLNIARENGFIKDESLEWIVPFQISQVEKWDVLLRDVLTKFAVPSRGSQTQ